MRHISLVEVWTRFDYHNGKLFKRKHIKNRKPSDFNNPVGSLHSDGHWKIKFRKRLYNRSKLIYAYHHKYFPKKLEHINRVKNDDRIENLRDLEYKEA